jgi:membrane protein DedA with SNARE-associated domain
MDVTQILELVRSQGNAIYALVASGAAWNSLLLPLFAGYAVQLEALAYWPTVAAVWAGGFAGDELRFWLARRYGSALFDQMPRIKSGVERAALVVDRHGWWLAFVYRYPHGIRGVAAFAFGLSRLPRLRFTALNFVSAGLWANATVGAGYAFAHLSDQALGEAATQFALALMVVFLGLAWLLSKQLEKKI